MTENAALKDALLARMTRWTDVPISTAIGRDGPGRRPDDVLVTAFTAAGEGMPWLRSDRTAAELGHRAHDWLLDHNQFSLVSRDTMVAMYADRLRAVADDLDHMGGEDVERLLARHLDAHRERFRRLVVADLGPAPAEVVAAEYSPQLQLEALALPGAPTGPVLDVGCGRRAALVQHLRAAGVPAAGLDLQVPTHLGVQADWLEANYGSHCWTTVTSHLGFALHFLHHHHAGHAVAERYAHAYMRILHSLRPGGTFVYVPSLPFIEDLLDPARWRPRRTVVPGTRITRTHVRRCIPVGHDDLDEDTP